MTKSSLYREKLDMPFVISVADLNRRQAAAAFLAARSPTLVMDEDGREAITKPAQYQLAAILGPMR